MNPENNKKFNLVMEATEMIPGEPRKQILEQLAVVENETDEIIKTTLEAIQTTLGDLGICL